MAKDRKQKHKMKRQQKRRMQQRATGNPYRIVTESGAIESCYINENWKKDGMAAIYVFKQVRSSYVMVCFLVDVLCLGLKDAFGRLDIGPAAFREAVEEYGRRVKMKSCKPELAWRLVAGGVRMARENGFRLPPRYERWLPVLGDPAECNTADLSDFRDGEGKLHFMGPLSDLRKRLVGCSLEDFLARDDVRVSQIVQSDDYEYDDDDDDADWDPSTDDLDPQGTFVPGEWDEDGLEDAAMQEMIFEGAVKEIENKTLDAVRRWLFSEKIEPHPRLAEAVSMELEAMLQCGPINDADENAMSQIQEQCTEHVEQMLALETPARRAELLEATEQYRRFIGHFKSPEQMMEQIGLSEADFEGQDG